MRQGAHQIGLRDYQRQPQEVGNADGISALGSVERRQLDSSDVAEILEDCVEDLKLSIDSLEPVEADLLLLLGTLRFRVGPRLDNMGIALRWEVKDVRPLDWL